MGPTLRLLPREACCCASPMLRMTTRLACMLCALCVLVPVSSSAFVRMPPGPIIAARRWGRQLLGEPAPPLTWRTGLAARAAGEIFFPGLRSEHVLVWAAGAC